MSRIEDELTKIVLSPGTKADRARALFALGCEKADVVELLAMNYSQAHSIWKALQSGRHRQDDQGTPAGRGRTGGARYRHDSNDGSGAGSDLESGLSGSKGHEGYLHLSPSQTRYITQDGHVVVRVETTVGPICQQCREPLNFSLKHLGFVHAQSYREPTNVEDHYVEA